MMGSHLRMARARNRRGFIVALSSLLILEAPLANETPAEDKDVIIVEGLRLPTPRTETGSSVSIITAADIKLRGLAFAKDALTAAPGVTVNQNGAFGGLTTVRIRGAASDHTLVLLDGAPMGDPSSIAGGYDFSLLDAADIERIEILKGPQSTLWGSDAIGGVINIVTKRPEEGVAASAFAEGGSFATYRGGAAASIKNDAGAIRLSVNGLSSDGISKADAADGNRERDAFESRTLAASGALVLPAGWRLDARAHHNKGRTEIDGAAPPSFLLADTDDESETRQWVSSAALTAPQLSGVLSQTLTAGYMTVTREGRFGGFETHDTGDRLMVRYQGTAAANNILRVAFGAEYERSNANDEATDIAGYFALYELRPLSGLTLSAGLRHDDHSRFGSATTTRAAVAWSPIDAFVLRGSWGEGFKAPTIFQLTQSFGALPANDALRPETSRAFDMGFDLTGWKGRVRLSGAYFKRDTENLIIFAPNFRYENLEATRTQGVEAAIEAALTPALIFSVNYAYIDAIDRATGAPQIRTPRHSGEIAMSYRSGGRFSGAAILTYNGEETDGAFGGDVDDWVRVDLSAQFRLSEKIEIYGRVENLLDADYQQVSGYGTPGLSGYAGVRAAF